MLSVIGNFFNNYLLDAVWAQSQAAKVCLPFHLDHCSGAISAYDDGVPPTKAMVSGYEDPSPIRRYLAFRVTKPLDMRLDLAGMLCNPF
jgi:hypothetical protein